jgi:hypothetical protein
MTTFWATMLLLTLKREDFVQNILFDTLCSILVWIQIRNRNRNFFTVGTEIKSFDCGL